MNVIVFGINHNSAPLELRERVAFVPEQMHVALQDAVTRAGVPEVAILSTCNRTEIYGVGEDDASQMAEALREWLASYHHVDEAELESCSYCYQGREALNHMMQVASGLDSMVLGEPQILGQMKSAFSQAVDAGTAQRMMHRVFSQVFGVAKKVRTDTAIGENPVSVAYAAVNLTQHVFSKLSQCTALLIGAGETIELVALHLREKGIKRIVIANRTLERARLLGEQLQVLVVDVVRLVDEHGALDVALH